MIISNGKVNIWIKVIPSMIPIDSLQENRNILALIARVATIKIFTDPNLLVNLAPNKNIGNSNKAWALNNHAICEAEALSSIIFIVMVISSTPSTKNIKKKTRTHIEYKGVKSCFKRTFSVLVLAEIRLEL